MTQKECFKLFEKHFDQIKQEFLAHNIKAKLDQHDFSMVQALMFKVSGTLLV